MFETMLAPTTGATSQPMYVWNSLHCTARGHGGLSGENALAARRGGAEDSSELDEENL